MYVIQLHETWSLIRREEQRLKCSRIEKLMKIFGSKREEDP